MANAVSAIDYLIAPDDYPPRPLCAVFGNDDFLKRQVLDRLRRTVLGTEGDFSLRSFEGPSAELRDVLVELGTVAMFGDRRLVVIEQADQFVTRYRRELEDYAAQPKSTGVLVLALESWPANTRLYKLLANSGLQVDCRNPRQDVLCRWLVKWAKQTHQVQLSSSCAAMLVEMVGTELGLLDQELAKLALEAGPGGKVTEASINQLVGTWRTRTVWEMLDAALAGNPTAAVVQLDRLLLAGEAPVAILAAISHSLRRLAAATRLVMTAESLGRRLSLRDALLRAGVNPMVVDKTEGQLRRLGRDRASRLYRWLLEADLGIKGASDLAPRMLLERLILRLAISLPR